MNTLTRETIVDRLRKYMDQNFPLFALQEVSVDDDLIENGVIDSLGYLEIITFVEDEFQIEVEDDQVTPENFQSIAAIATYIQSQMGTKEVKVQDGDS